MWLLQANTAGFPVLIFAQLRCYSSERTAPLENHMDSQTSVPSCPQTWPPFSLAHEPSLCKKCCRTSSVPAPSNPGSSAAPLCCLPTIRGGLLIGCCLQSPPPAGPCPALSPTSLPPGQTLRPPSPFMSPAVPHEVAPGCLPNLTSGHPLPPTHLFTYTLATLDHKKTPPNILHSPSCGLCLSARGSFHRGGA